MFGSKALIIFLTLITCFLGYELFDLLTENLLALFFNHKHDTLDKLPGSLYKVDNTTMYKNYKKMGPPKYGMTKVRSQKYRQKHRREGCVNRS